MKKMRNTPAAVRAFAVFDVDGTIFRSSLLIELVELLIIRGLFPESARKTYEAQYTRWRERADSYEQYIEAVVRAFTTNIKGVHYSDFMTVAEEVVALHKHHTYRYTRDLIETLKQQEYFLLAISHSPKAIVEPFCRELGFDKTYGFLYETGPESRFTGAVTDEHLMHNKGVIVRRAAELEGLTFRGSWGVGDTQSDISMLELVEHAIAFNPNRSLYRYARRMEWPVVVERKDVIYEL
jgi:HAD superfamily hydrolase (TIGR01490 family)